MSEFDQFMQAHQLAWRKQHIADPRSGTQIGKTRPWILPAEIWEQGLWPGIRQSLPAYLKDSKDQNGQQVKPHGGVHNLKSSWTQCANVYFPFGTSDGKPLLAGFLSQHVSDRIEAVEAVELEYAEDSSLDPQTLLGESKKGHRGANQTSPDVAFKVLLAGGGRGLILTENKLVEHWFYACSGLKREADNPNEDRCFTLPALLDGLPGSCWQMCWEKEDRPNRKYWEHIRLSEQGRRTLTRCPAATGGYQLFRQQALAEGIAASGRYDFVASCVAYDARNDALIHCLRDSGVDNFAAGWGALFDGRAQFATWTHQQWVSWVRANDRGGQWRDCLSYVETRYQYGETDR